MDKKRKGYTAELWAHRALVLACLTIAMAAALVIIEKTPLGMVALLAVFLLSSTYPVMFFTGWFTPEHRKKRVARLASPMLLLLAFTGWIGYTFWPKPKIRVLEMQPEHIFANVPLSVRLTYRNDGHDANVVVFYRLIPVDDVPFDMTEREKQEDSIWNTFKNGPTRMPHRATVLEGTTEYGTMVSDLLVSPALAATFNTPFSPTDKVLGARRGPGIYIVGEIRFVGIITEVPVSFCGLFQGDVDLSPKCVKQY
jgi:hypothetical protein